MIGRSGERGSGISVLAARHDDDDDDIYIYIYEYIYIYIYISSVSKDYGCGIFVYGIYEGVHINLEVCSMYGYYCVGLLGCL